MTKFKVRRIIIQITGFISCSFSMMFFKDPAKRAAIYEGIAAIPKR